MNLIYSFFALLACYFITESVWAAFLNSGYRQFLKALPFLGVGVTGFYILYLMAFKQIRMADLIWIFTIFAFLLPNTLHRVFPKFNKYLTAV